MTSDVEKEIQRLGLDALSAQKMAAEGRIEEWAHRFLLSGKGNETNPGFSASLRQEKRWWNGPVEVNLADLSPAVGTEPSMEYVVQKDDWYEWTSNLAKTFSQPLALPPLIIEYRSGELSIRDGNTRYGAMQHLKWQTCWVVIWYNTEADFHKHSQLLRQAK